MDSAGVAVRALIAWSDHREASDIGRRARLELRFVRRRGRTVLADAYAEPPFRIGRCFSEGEGVHMIMASSAPGVFGGDWMEQVIHVEPGATVRLTSQSAVQVHPAPGPTTATIRSRYIVAEGAALTCVWDPLIPFAASRIDQRCDLHVADGGRLVWSDAFMSGREARGERWRFASLAHELGMWRGDALGYLERYRITPADHSGSRRWIAADACYFGTILVSRDEVPANTAESLHNSLAPLTGVRAAADALDKGLLLVRLMASEGIPFHAARKLAVRGLVFQ
jgi:urease accessory protein